MVHGMLLEVVRRQCPHVNMADENGKLGRCPSSAPEVTEVGGRRGSRGVVDSAALPQPEPQRRRRRPPRALVSADERMMACERERNRVREMNHAYGLLQRALPAPATGKPGEKLTKLECLRLAINYIRDLEDMLETCPSPSEHSMPPSPSTPPSPASSYLASFLAPSPDSYLTTSPDSYLAPSPDSYIDPCSPDSCLTPSPNSHLTPSPDSYLTASPNPADTSSSSWDWLHCSNPSTIQESAPNLVIF